MKQNKDREEFLDCFTHNSETNRFELLPRRTPEKIWKLVVETHTQKKVEEARKIDKIKMMIKLEELLTKQEPVVYHRDGGIGWAVPCKELFTLRKKLSLNPKENKNEKI